MKGIYKDFNSHNFGAIPCFAHGVLIPPFIFYFFLKYKGGEISPPKSKPCGALKPKLK